MSNETISRNGTDSYVVEFQNDIEDAVAFQVHYMRTSPEAKRALRRSYIFIPIVVIAVGIIIYLQDPESWLQYLPWLCVFMVLYLLLFAFLNAKRRKSVLQQLRNELNRGENRSFRARTRLTLNDQGIKTESEVGEAFKSWSGIEKVVNLPDYIYIYDGSLSAHIVPRRAFADAMTFEAFGVAAERFHRSFRLAQGARAVES